MTDTTGDDDPNGSSTDSVDPGSSGDPTELPPSSESSGGEPPPTATCPEWSTCGTPLDCSIHSCGGLYNVGEDGCPRPFCESNDECPDGYSCYRPNDWGTCGAHLCTEFDGVTCDCDFGLDCNSNAHCVPEELVPPFGAIGPSYCHGFTDATSCGEALAGFEEGSCAWYDGWQLPVDGSCVDAQPTSACVYVRNRGSGPASPTCSNDPNLYPVYSVEGDVVTVLLADPEDPPYPAETKTSPFWLDCSDPLPGFDPTPACECACSA